MELELFPKPNRSKGKVLWGEFSQWKNWIFDRIGSYWFIWGEQLYKWWDWKFEVFSHENESPGYSKLLIVLAMQSIFFYEGKTPIAPNPPWEGGFNLGEDQLGNHWMGFSSQGWRRKDLHALLGFIPLLKAFRRSSLFNHCIQTLLLSRLNGALGWDKKEGEKVDVSLDNRLPINNYGSI